MLSAYRARIQKFDHTAMIAISPHQHPVLTATLRALTWTGHGGAWAFAVVTLLLGIRYDFVRFPHREFTLNSTLAPAIAWVFAKLIKMVVRRRRPFQVLSNFSSSTTAPSDDSFPSGHAASVFAFLTAMTPLGPVVATPIAVWASIVSFSRYYLGVHFPSDIFAGALVGVISGTGFIVFVSLPIA